jgi:hypothetical protein
MTYTATIYFLGDYRPMYIEDTAPARLKIRLAHAIEETKPETRDFLGKAITTALEGIARGYAATACEHGPLGLSIRAGQRDRWLDHITDKMPECPGLNYNA